MAPKIEAVTKGHQIGEAPHWDAETQSLYFVDVVGQYIHKYVPSTKKLTKAHLGKKASLIIPVKGKNDQFVVTSDREVVVISWDGENDKVSVLQKLYEEENTGASFNDGKCDSTGRLWAGTAGSPTESGDFPKDKGSFYSFEKSKVKKQLSSIGLSNGLAFDTNLKKLYHIDSLKGTLDQYDFDVKTGTISNGKPIFTFAKKIDTRSWKVLDGLTIDTDGNLWVAVFNDSRVLKIDPRRPETIVQTIQFPAKQITSVAFGGPNLDELYVTSGNLTLPGFLTAEESSEGGSTFRVTGLNVKGLPGVRVVL